MKVLKRDGREKEFDIQRIYTAMQYAFKDVYLGNYNEEDLDKAKKAAYEYFNSLNYDIIIDIETIQDVVVDILKSIDAKVSNCYEEYREQRTIERDRKSTLDVEIDNVINGVSEESTANGNVDGSKIQSIRAIITNIVCRDFSRRHYIPKKYRKKQKKSLYIHDEYYFGLPFFNCCVANWQNMFEGGFDLGTTHINTPKSLSTAVNVLTQVASHISSNTYGGTTFGSLVTGLCPYGVKSLAKWRVIGHKYIHDRDEAEQFAWEMFKKEAKDCAQSIEYEIQTLMTSRGETPFLTLGINVIDPNATPEEQEVQRIIATAILNQRLEGLTDGVTPVFPKLVFQLKEGNNLNPGDPNYDLFKLAVKTSARRSYPDYTMTEKVIEVTGSYKEPMGKKAA